ncbi:hypothetical protein N7472_009643, partial [Penicillium cf. griseofulvum]
IESSTKTTSLSFLSSLGGHLTAGYFDDSAVCSPTSSQNHLAAMMAYTTSYDGSNYGIQVGQNLGHITNHFPCLRDLRTTNPHHDKDRIQSTNGGLLKDSYCWILDNEEFQQWQDNQSNGLLWIRGDPGKGKTMLLCGIIEELTRRFGNTANISFFFCQATDRRINNATAVLRGLMYSLVEKQPSLISYVRSQYDKAGKALFEDINAWDALLRIFTDVLKDPTLQRTYLIIDALDECTTGLPSLLDLVTRVSSAYSQIKWIVSSRNWPEIEERFNTTRTAPISLELNEASVSEAVSKFIQHKVHYLAKVKKYSDETRDTIYRHLSYNSQGTFLWVALVCQDLNRISRRHAIKKLEEFPPGLNALYGRMIDQVRNSVDAELCKRILAIMSIVYRPIAFQELASVIELSDDLLSDNEALTEIISTCGSFLTLRDDTIIFVHQSAKEYLLSEARNEIFPCGKEAGHHTIFLRSLQAMFKTLRRSNFPGLTIDQVRRPSSNPLAHVQYACVYWVDHLQDGSYHESGDASLDEGGLVDLFLRQKYLHWLEALSNLGSLYHGIVAMLRLERLLQGEPHALLHQVRDASRFIRYHRLAIQSSPLQVYCSSLIFSPLQSITRKCYQNESPSWVLNEPVAENHWSPCLQTLEGHSHQINSIDWSKDRSRLASASSDNTVRIWDSTTGQCASTLEGHDRSVNSITWSPGGGRLASASHDKTVKIWDPITGQCVSTLEGHSKSVIAIAWSQDGSRLASMSEDKTARIWDLATSRCIFTIGEFHGERYPGPMMWIAWSQDGSRLASASRDNIVKIWDPVTGQCTLSLEGHSTSVSSVSWSQDGKQLASVSLDNTVRIWDPATGHCASTLRGQSGWVKSIVWTQDGSRLASWSNDNIVRIWDPATGQCTSTLEGHSAPVNSISWSQEGSRLASASDDKTVRIWDPATGQCTSTLEGHSAPVSSISWSQGGSQLASASADKTVKIWDTTTGHCASTLERHSDEVISIVWSQDGSRLASASWDRTARIWNPVTGHCTSTLEGHSGPIMSISWSQDGSRLASASQDKTVRIWNPITGHCTSTLEGHSRQVNSVAWSQDGSRLASTSFDNTVRIWDPATGHCTLTLEGQSGWLRSIAWSQDGSRLALASLDNSIRILDPSTGQCKLNLEGHSGTVSSIGWSTGGDRLASVSDDKTVRIWDSATGQCKRTLLIDSPGFVQFDKLNHNRLHTTIGTLDIASDGFGTSASNSSTSLPEIRGFGLNSDFSWVTHNGVNLLWLPVEYRPVSAPLFAIFATTVAICCPSSRILFLSLSERSSLSRF